MLNISDGTGVQVKHTAVIKIDDHRVARLWNQAPLSLGAPRFREVISPNIRVVAAAERHPVAELISRRSKLLVQLPLSISQRGNHAFSQNASARRVI